MRRRPWRSRCVGAREWTEAFPSGREGARGRWRRGVHVRLEAAQRVVDQGVAPAPPPPACLGA
eukprot:8776131-Lingulodinium_polyedra.AAC.1